MQNKNLSTETKYKIIVFSFCMVMLMQSIYELTAEYIKYPTNVEVGIKKPRDIELPGVTICTIGPYEPWTVQPAREALNKRLLSMISCRIMSNTISQKMVSCDEVSPPLLSKIKEHDCITYFSTLNPNGHQTMLPDSSYFGTKIYFGYIDILPSNDTELLNKIQNFYVIYHQSNSLPDHDTHRYAVRKALVKRGHWYCSIFSKYSIKRMASPYQSNCFDYENNKKNNVSVYSRYDCYEQCLKQDFMDKCSCIPDDLNIIERHFNDKNFNTTFCKGNQIDMKCAEEIFGKKNRYKCDNKCNVDCKNDFYSYEVFDEGDVKEVVNPKEVVSRVFLAAKFGDEVFYIHHKKYSLSEFIANICGLVSWWIGVSMLTIYNVSLLFFDRLKKFGVKNNKILDEKLLEMYKNKKDRFEDAIWVVAQKFQKKIHHQQVY